MNLPPLIWILGLVLLQRLGELVIARHNTRRLLSRGGREVGAAHYPLFILLHGSWLVAIAASVPIDHQPSWPLVAVYAALQACRAWVIATLGPYWTTRIITIDDAPLVTRGPFRFVRHPNYWVVCAEIAVLPLAFGDWPVALIWSGLNSLLLRHRIKVEDGVLRARSVSGAAVATRGTIPQPGKPASSP